MITRKRFGKEGERERKLGEVVRETTVLERGVIET
jgi:hypothetical protein